MAGSEREPLPFCVFDLNTGEFTDFVSNLQTGINYLLYDETSQTLSAYQSIMSNQLWTTGEVTSQSLLNPSSTPWNWITASGLPGECTQPLVWMRRAQQLFVVCEGKFFAQQSIMAFTVGESINATLQLTHPVMLLDAKAQPNLCGIATLLGTLAFKWNARTQTLYVACSSGSAAAISIQATNSTSPIVTSLISTGVCSQAVSMLSVVYSSPTNVTVILQCPEGLFSTSGRSLHLTARVLSLSPLLIFDSVGESIFLISLPPGTGDPSTHPSVYLMLGLELSSIVSNTQCPTTLSFAKRSSMDQDQFLLVCLDSDTTSTIILGGSTDDGQFQRSFIVPQPSYQMIQQQTTFATSYGFFLLLDSTINFLQMYPTINPIPVQITGLEPNVNANILDLQIVIILLTYQALCNPDTQ